MVDLRGPGQKFKPEEHVVFNGVHFKPVKGAKYKFNYIQIAQDIFERKIQERDVCRELLKRDLWFLVYFVLGIPCANHPFWIKACAEVDDGPPSHTLDLWAREHGKALSLNTDILTSDGWKTMRDIKEGDYVVGSDGRFTKVTWVSNPSFYKQAYKITFAYGNVTEIVADAGHQWVVLAKRRINKKPFTLTTEEIYKHYQSLKGTSAKFSIKSAPFLREDGYEYTIQKVEKAPSEPMRCISVDAPDKLYAITKRMILTHNSTIITIASSIKKVIENPNETIAIFSYTREAATVFLRNIKFILENNLFLQDCYPDIFYRNPASQAYKWGEETGLYVQRDSQAREATFEAWGLLKGMPTGRHFSGRIYDDVETFDMAYSPDMMLKLIDTFELSHNLGTNLGWHRVTGTPYHHEGLLMYLKKKSHTDESKVYFLREKPATDDGTPRGKPVYLTQERLDELKVNKKFFNSQQLLNPTPTDDQSLNPDFLKFVELPEIPKLLFKFMVIDPAGSQTAKRKGDCWAIHVIGLEPFIDDIGASNVFLLDTITEEMGMDEAMNAILQVYRRNGKILKVGVEKVGISTMEIHISNALRAEGINLSIDTGNLVVLRPQGRSKQERIEMNLVYPLNHGKIHISKEIPEPYIYRLKMEMQKFPYWHDDMIDAFSYFYDLIKEYKFGNRLNFSALKEQDEFDRRYKRRRRVEESRSWMGV